MRESSTLFFSNIIVIGIKMKSQNTEGFKYFLILRGWYLT
ncbi:hypothetical protein FEDK69T_06690 [Flavobacterium enshiense DK69]|nr:hypothetical protein FEDK69T_06690 [Flavobacterium enshiense DK69]